MKHTATKYIEKASLDALAADFHDDMVHRLHEKVDAGYRHWDKMSYWGSDNTRERMLAMISNGKWVDLANMAMFMSNADSRGLT